MKIATGKFLPGQFFEDVQKELGNTPTPKEIDTTLQILLWNIEYTARLREPYQHQ